MKASILIILLWCHLLAYGQFDFQPDSSDSAFPFEKFKGTELAWPNQDSIVFELRFWVYNDFGGLLQLTYNKDSTWNCRRGFLSNGFQTVELTSSSPNFDTVWNKLKKNHILNLPNQDELIYTYHKDGRSVKIGPEKESTEPLIHNTTDGTGYSIELFKGERYRHIYYYNAILLNKLWENSEWESKETEYFANMANLLIDSFAMHEVFQMNLREKTGKK